MLLRAMLFSSASEAQANTKVLHVYSTEYTSKHLLDVGVVKRHLESGRCKGESRQAKPGKWISGK